MTRPVVEFYDDREIVVINGIKYTYAFFESLGIGGLPTGTVLEIGERAHDNVLLLRHYSREKGYERDQAIRDLEVEAASAEVAFDSRLDLPPLHLYYRAAARFLRLKK